MTGGSFRVGPPQSVVEGNNGFAVALVITIPLLYFPTLQVKVDAAGAAAHRQDLVRRRHLRHHVPVRGGGHRQPLPKCAAVDRGDVRGVLVA